MYNGVQKNMKLKIIRFFSFAANQHIRMISEGSCDTEDWNNDAENSDLITGISYILKYSHRKNTFLKSLLFLIK